MDTKQRREKNAIDILKQKPEQRNETDTEREKSKQQPTNHCVCVLFYLWFFWNVSGIFVRAIIWLYMHEHAPSKESLAYFQCKSIQRKWFNTAAAASSNRKRERTRGQHTHSHTFVCNIWANKIWMSNVRCPFSTQNNKSNRIISHNINI